ncbi:helix-turn-helix domain-containing protein [Helicobacter cinaedi]|uniref:Helix-turn-helix domain-containing protein n=1 Tax=Helicobacter cinaedi TaxID=213 RepID=A0A377JV58_9HELI|nr:helix-turn-helix domain-containing protein [Helicobacter cinaedi]
MQKQWGNATQEEISEFYKRISANIRILREERGISQLDLALEIGIKSVAFYSKW